MSVTVNVISATPLTSAGEDISLSVWWTVGRLTTTASGAQHFHPMRLQPGGGGVELGEGRDEDDRPIAAPGEQHAIGVDAQLEGVAHVRGARVTHGAGVGPGLTFPCLLY